MTGEGSRGPVVPAVDVGADGAADGDMAGRRGHRDEPAEREQRPQQAAQAHPGVADHRPRDGVDRADPVQRGHVEHGAARVLRGVTMGAPQPPGDHPARSASAHDHRGLLVRARAEPQRGRRGGAAPAGQGHRVDRHDRDRIAQQNPYEGFVTALTEMGDCWSGSPRTPVFCARTGTRRAWTG